MYDKAIVTQDHGNQRPAIAEVCSPCSDSKAPAFFERRGPLLAGHGGSSAELHGVIWRDWRASAEAGLARLREHCSAIVVCGFSAGGLLESEREAVWSTARAWIEEQALYSAGNRL